MKNKTPMNTRLGDHGIPTHIIPPKKLQRNKAKSALALNLSAANAPVKDPKSKPMDLEADVAMNFSAVVL